MPRTKDPNSTRLGFTVSTKLANQIRGYAMLSGVEPDVLIRNAVLTRIGENPLDLSALNIGKEMETSPEPPSPTNKKTK